MTAVTVAFSQHHQCIDDNTIVIAPSYMSSADTLSAPRELVTNLSLHDLPLYGLLFTEVGLKEAFHWIN